MRMPKTSSFSVRDILDLGPKQATAEDNLSSAETKLPVIKKEQEQRPDLVKTGQREEGKQMPLSQASVSSSSPSNLLLRRLFSRPLAGHWRRQVDVELVDDVLVHVEIVILLVDLTTK